MKANLDKCLLLANTGENITLKTMETFNQKLLNIVFDKFNFNEHIIPIWGHPFSTYAKFSVRVRIRG